MMRDRARARLSQKIARQLAEILEFETKDPVLRAAAPTVMGVELSWDGKLAVVYVALAGAHEERGKVVAAFARDRGFLRTRLAHRLRVRRVPELRFELAAPLEWNWRMEAPFREENPGN